jgi:hypothetical protein
MYRLLLLTILASAAWAQTNNGGAQNSVQPGTIDGHVLNAQTGEGISGANVRFVPMVVVPNKGSVVTRTATTGPDGSFHLDNVMPGSYVVIASRDGFLPNRVSSGRPVAVTVSEGQQASGVSIELNPEATATGTVLGSDGKPIPGAQVAVFAVRPFRGEPELREIDNATADASGKYKLGGLAPGNYYFAAAPASLPRLRKGSQKPAPKERAAMADAGPGLVRTFYPRALNPEDATAVQVTAGQTMTGIDITLLTHASYRVRGRIAGFSNLTPRQTMVTLSLRNALHAGSLRQTVRPNVDGSFEFGGVLPGSYTLWLRGSYADAPSNPMIRQRPRMIAREDIDVGNSDLSGIELAAIQPISVSGELSLENGHNENLSNVRVALTALEDIPARGMRTVDVINGSAFSFENLEPARYSIAVMNAPAGTYIKSISFNKQDVTHSGIDLTQGESGQLEIVLRTGAGEVDGTIEASQDQIAGPATVVLIPEAPLAGGSGLLFSAARPGNNFVIANVPPGHYYAIAVEQYDPMAWQNADFVRQMQAEATGIDVGESAHTEVQLAVTSVEQLHQIAARLGLQF